MKMDLSCPVELWQTEMPTAEYPACALKLYNLTEQLMVSVEVTLLLLDKNGEEQSRVLFRAHDLHGEPGKTFRMAVPVQLNGATPEQCEVVFEKVWYEDGTAWRRTRGSTLSFVSNVLPRGRELDALKLIAGETAVGFPEEQENGWLCVCGRPNPLDSGECIRCKRQRDTIFEQFNREAVLTEVQQRQEQRRAKTQKALEDASARHAEMTAKDEQRRKKRHRLLALLATAALLGTAVYVGVFHIKPYLAYHAAEQAFNEGHWLEAEAAFTALGDYSDAEQYVLRCRYQQASALSEKRDAAQLEQAESAFLALGDYEDAAQRALAARNLRADVLLESGDVIRALELYMELDQLDGVNRCKYLLACDMLENGDYGAAMSAFQELGEYDDAAAKLTEATFGRVKAVLAMGAADEYPDEALGLLDTMDGEDAKVAQLRQQAWYFKGVQLLAENRHDEAGEAFLKAGDYEDAEAKACECIYQPACAAQDAGRLPEAAEQFAKIPGYADADERWQQCMLGQARSAVKDMEYRLATSLLAQLPQDDAEVQELQKQCVYEPAVRAMDDKRYEDAIAGFEQLGDYKDSAKKLQTARYAWAGDQEQSDPDGAMALYEQLGDYKDSAAKLKTLRYSTAVSALEDGELDRAETLFLQLGSYKDSQKRLQDVAYARAEKLLLGGDEEAAIQAFAALDGYQDSADRISGIRYQQADRLLANGDEEAAIQAFAALDGYQDSTDRVNAIRYQQANRLWEAGDEDAAVELFTALGSYQDSADCVRKINYQRAELRQAGGELDEAEALFAALGDYEDSADRVLAIRYERAGQLYKISDYAGAIEAYQALGDYKDSADMVLEARYMAAEQMDNEERYAEAEAAYQALGDYRDCENLVLKMRYKQAEVLLADGHWKEAKAGFEALDDYADAADRMKDCDILYAQELEAHGDDVEAEAVYLSLGDYGNAQRSLHAMYYRQAKAAEMNGSLELASVLYLKAGDHEDAAAHAEDCMRVFRDAQSAAQAAMDQGDAMSAVQTLQAVDLTMLPEQFSGLNELYGKAVWRAADRLLTAGDAEEAAALLDNVPEEMKALVPEYQAMFERACITAGSTLSNENTNLLTYLLRIRTEESMELLRANPEWLLLGTWSNDEHTYVFNPDGTCILDGEKLYYKLDGFNISTGTAPDQLKVTHKVAETPKENLIIRDLRGKREARFVLTWRGPCELEKLQ